MTMSTHLRPPLVRRNGMLTVSVLVCLTILMTLYAVWMRSVLFERQQTRAEEDRVQADYLALSALARAAARLDSDEAYQGETWRVEPTAHERGPGGTVTIRIEPVEGQPHARLVTVDAHYPAEEVATARSQQAKTIVLHERGATP